MLKPGNPGHSGHSGHYSRRSNLFVVRIWRDDTGGTLGTCGTVEGEDEGEDRAIVEWQGRVQRAVSGEEHRFLGWPALIDLLEAMLSDKQPR